MLITKTDLENAEVSIHQNSYLRVANELSTYILNGNTCKCVTPIYTSPEKVGIFAYNTFQFFQLKKSRSLNSSKKNVEVKKIDNDINSIKYPTPTLRSINKLKKEDYTREKIKQEAKQNLFNIMNGEIKMQQIREEHKQLGINRDTLGKISKSQNTHTQGLTDFEKITLIFVYAMKEQLLGMV